jgi:hypothetical protein
LTSAQLDEALSVRCIRGGPVLGGYGAWRGNE